MDIQLLRDPDIVPDGKTLADYLGENSYRVYDNLKKLAEIDFGLNIEWRYYKDGKAWLCKVTKGKKTVFWLSAWNGFLKTSFYFTEKTRNGISELPINGTIKKMFEKAAPAGKLIPLILNIDREAQLSDLEIIIKYKLSR